MKVRAAVCTGLEQPWTTEEIEIDDPHAHEVLVTMAYAGMCQSDEHLRSGSLAADEGTLAMMGLSSMFPVIGGHEGAGVVEAVGPEVNALAPGDHVAMSFIPACGVCHWCASGRQHLCDLGLYTLVGPMFSDFTWRHHLAGEPLNRMTQLGTFSEKIVVNEASLVKIGPDDALHAAALISCGLATGFGSAVDRAKVAPGEVVVVVGAGGVGSGAIQGARLAGASAIVVVDPLESKIERARKIGATHGVSDLADARMLVAELSDGRLADVVILTPTTLSGDLLAPACALGSKDGRIVATAIAPVAQRDVQLDLFSLSMFNQTLMGTVFGSMSPRVQIPRLLKLYAQGHLEIDELITQRYSLDQVQAGYDDLAAGKNVRGIVDFGLAL
jgi:NDMA-dependent alcohol dehydrogenase